MRKKIDEVKLNTWFSDSLTGTDAREADKSLGRPDGAICGNP